jgi:hypothetical protein
VKVHDTLTGDLLYTLMYLRDNHWIAISPEGYYKGSPGVEAMFHAIVQKEDGSQEVVSLSDFAAKYGWKNDPAKVKFAEN